MLLFFSPCHSSADLNVNDCCYTVICYKAMFSSKTPNINKNCSDFSRKTSVGLGVVPGDGGGPWQFATGFGCCGPVWQIRPVQERNICKHKGRRSAFSPSCSLFPAVFKTNIPPHPRGGESRETHIPLAEQGPLSELGKAEET